MKQSIKTKVLLSTALAMRTLQKDYELTGSKDIQKHMKKMEQDFDNKMEEYINNQKHNNDEQKRK